MVPEFRRVGEAPTMAEMRAASRQNLVSVNVHIALQQRPGMGDVRQFSRRAVGDLFACVAGQAHGMPVPPLRDPRHRDGVLSGILDTTSALAVKLLAASGAVRGVFVSPFLGGRGGFPTIPGFGDGCHSVVWARTAHFSDVIVATLRDLGVEFDGLVCGREGGDVGIRIRVGADGGAVVRALEQSLQARVRPQAAAPRARLRARGVPASLVPEHGLQRVVDALGGGLTLVEARVLDLFAFSANVDLVVSGSLVGDQWVLRDLGLRPVVVKRLPPRQMGQRLPLAPAARVPAPRRVLSGGEKLSWAERVRAPPPACPEEMVVDDVAPVVVEEEDLAAVVAPRPQSAKAPARVAAKAAARGLKAWLAPVVAVPAPKAAGPRVVAAPTVVAPAAVAPASVAGEQVTAQQLARLERLMEDLRQELRISREENARLRAENERLIRALPAPRAGAGHGLTVVSEDGANGGEGDDDVV